MRWLTIDIPTGILALDIRASGDIAQDPFLTNAVTVLIFVLAVDRCNCCRITPFLLMVRVTFG